MRPPPLEWYDAALLGLLAFFYFLKAILLRRMGRLGWAMTASCVTVGTLFLYGIALRHVAWLQTHPAVGSALRAMVVVSVVWAVGELLLVRRQSRTPPAQ